MRGAADGVSYAYCRHHVAHKSRHGSTWRTSLTQLELRPFHLAAKRWLKDNGKSPMVAMAARELQALLDGAGSIVFAGLLRDLPPAEKATQALARLRERGKPPLTILGHVLAVMAALRGLDGIPRDDDYHLCQIGKRLHLLAGGYRWQVTLPDGTVRQKGWHPEPRGQALRHLARMVLRVMDRGFAASDIRAIAKEGSGG